MSVSHTRRQALYFPTPTLYELQRESSRQDRSISWLIQQAWRIARNEMQQVPAATANEAVAEMLDRRVEH